MWHNANSISKLKLTGLLIRLSTNHPLCFYRPESRLYFHKMQHKPFVYTCKLRNHLKRNHFIVRCKLILRSYLEVLCQGTELVVCLLLSTNNTTLNTNAQIFDTTQHMTPGLEKSSARPDGNLKSDTTNQTDSNKKN